MTSPVAIRLVDPNSVTCYRPASVASMNGLTIISCFTGGALAWNASSYTTISLTSLVPAAGAGNAVNFDPITGLLYISANYKGIYQYNVTSGAGGTVPFLSYSICSNPDGVLTTTFQGQPLVFASCRYNYPFELVLTHRNGTILGKMVNSFVCSIPSGLIIRGNYGYVTCASSTGTASIVMFDLRNTTATIMILSTDPCNSAYSPVLHPVTGDIHVACYATSNLVAIDQANNVTPVPLSTQCGNPWSLYYDPQNRFHIYLCVQGGVLVNTFQKNIPLVSLANPIICPRPIDITTFSPANPLDRQLSFVIACSDDAPILTMGRVVTQFKTDSICQTPGTTLRAPNGDYYTTCWGSTGFYSGSLVQISGGKFTTLVDYNQCPNPIDLVALNETQPDYLIACGSSFIGAWVNASFVSPIHYSACISPQYFLKDYTRNII